MRVLLLDNLDSFTYNLYHYLEQCCEEVVVRRNDALELHEVDAFDGVVLSPGPGLPAEAGIMPRLIERFAPEKPILGVCLGHQAIAQEFGAHLKNLQQVHHGVAIPITVTDSADPIFRNLPRTFPTGRYHSWVVERATLPAVLCVTAVDAEGEVMALRHREFNVCGLQFHPESLLTPHGISMVENWVNSCKVAVKQR